MSAEDIEYMDNYKEFPTKESALDWLDNYLSLDERNKLIRALRQEPILEKIRAEIEDTGAYEQEVHGKTEFLKGITYCLNIIDKHLEELKGEK